MMRAVLVLVALVAAFGQLPEERRLRQTDHVAAGHEVKSNETEPETERAVKTERTDGTDEAHPDGVTRVHEFEQERMVRDEEGALLKVPNTVAGACILFTALAYIWFVCGFAGLFTVKDGYLNLGASKPLLPWYYWLAAFLYWVAMPLSMLYISANADCQGGPPDVGYLVFGVFLTVHIILVIVAMCQHPTPPGACDCSKGFFLSGPLLIFFMILDHMDMAIDAMFVGTAAACSPMIENAYVQSWAAIPVIGAELKFTIEALSFTGLALFAFVVMAYLPQLVGLTPFFALCSTLVCSSLMLLTLHQSWIWGVVVTALICIALGLGGVFRKQWQVWKDANADDEKTLGLFACMGIFEQLLSQGQQNERLLFVTMTKLVFENLFQLWLQSSFFALTFKFTGPEARMKTVLSMAIGLLVLASKVPGLITELRTGPNQVNLFAGFTCGTFIAWILLLVVIFYAIVIVWITLKIVMAYQCDSHVWNLTLHVWSLKDGCLP